MIKFLNILDQVITEGKRYQFDPETHYKLNMIVDQLWRDRNKVYRGKTTIDQLPVKLLDGTEGLVRVVVNPRLSYQGLMGTKPSKSFDPADLFIEVNPKNYESRKNLYLIVYHELLHAVDPTQSVKWRPSYQMTYDETSDEKYWGHPIEFFAMTNEFLEGLVLEFERRIYGTRNIENLKYLEKSLKNILNHFARGEKLTRFSKDIFFRINDEHLEETSVSKALENLTVDHPGVADYLAEHEDDPYYLIYINMIKMYNPKIWPNFLKMLYSTAEEIKRLIKSKKGV